MAASSSFLRGQIFKGLWSVSGHYNRRIGTTVCTMGAYDAEFNKAKERLNSLKEDPGNEVKLKIYALFKQATIGKCNAPKPGMMDLVGKYKWNAWNDLGDMSQDDAQKAYIDLVNSLAGAQADSAPEASSTSSSQKFETLAIDNSNGVYSITLNRPNKKNAINFQMYEDLIQALKEAGEDNSIILATVTVKPRLTASQLEGSRLRHSFYNNTDTFDCTVEQEEHESNPRALVYRS